MIQKSFPPDQLIIFEHDDYTHDPSSGYYTVNAFLNNNPTYEFVGTFVVPKNHSFSSVTICRMIKTSHLVIQHEEIKTTTN